MKPSAVMFIQVSEGSVKLMNMNKLAMMMMNYKSTRKIAVNMTSKLSRGNTSSLNITQFIVPKISWIMRAPATTVARDREMCKSNHDNLSRGSWRQCGDFM